MYGIRYLRVEVIVSILLKINILLSVFNFLKIFTVGLISVHLCISRS